jgi:hypothetical protein
MIAPLHEYRTAWASVEASFKRRIVRACPSYRPQAIGAPEGGTLEYETIRLTKRG